MRISSSRRPRGLLAIAAAVALVGLAAPTAPIASARPPAATIAIVGVTVVDVVAGKPLPDHTIIIDGKIIAQVGPSASTAVPEGARRIDGRGLHAIPGLMDGHVHVADAASYGPLFIANGVTFVRELGSYTETIVPQRDLWNTEAQIGPRMIVTGAIIDGDPPVWPFSKACTTPEQGRAAVNELADAGVDLIKVYARLPKDVWEAVLDEASKRGLDAVGHVPDAVPFAEAVAKGQRTCEHLIGFEELVAEVAGAPNAPGTPRFSGMLAWMRWPTLDREKLRAALAPYAKSGTAFVPTLVVLDRISRLHELEKLDADPRLAYVPPLLRAYWGNAIDRLKGFSRPLAGITPHMRELVAELDRAGATIVAGTDVSNPYLVAGFSLHDELALLQEAGLTPAAVLRAATVTPAKVFHVEDRLGTIEAGKLASIVLVREDPLADVRNATKIETVIREGRVFDRASLDALLAGVKERVTGAPSATPVALELPGRLVARGRYRLTFAGQDAGTEEFLITRTPDGAFRLMAINRPAAGWIPPSVTTITTDRGRRVRSGGWRTLVPDGVEARYELGKGLIEARATRAGSDEPAQTATLKESGVFTGPVVSQEALTLLGLGIAPGESRDVEAAGFGSPDWKVATGMIRSIVRDGEPVETTGPDGAKVSATRYASTLVTLIGDFESEALLDERGVVVRWKNASAFGEVTAMLEEVEVGPAIAELLDPSRTSPSPSPSKRRGKLY